MINISKVNMSNLVLVYLHIPKCAFGRYVMFISRSLTCPHNTLLSVCLSVGKYTYTCTVRKFVKGETAETRRQITAKEYDVINHIILFTCIALM